MKIKTVTRDSSNDSWNVWSDIPTARVLILGNCKGIALHPRGRKDEHVLFTILTEDDEDWFVSGSGSSSYWMPELVAVLDAAKEWMDTNCLSDNGRHGEVWGYVFQ